MTAATPECPDWLYGQGCSDGHTGRPAMSLLARATDLGGAGCTDDEIRQKIRRLRERQEPC